MARKQRIYTRYKPEQKIRSHTTQKSSKGRLLVILITFLGVSMWLAASGLIVLPESLQQLVRSEPSSENPDANEPELPPAQKLTFGTEPQKVNPVAAVNIERPQPKAPIQVAPLPPPRTATNTVTAKPTIEVNLSPAPKLEPFSPRSAWSTFDVQLALARNAVSPGILDGLSGPQTVLALKAFQRKVGLEPTGKPDLKTKSRLVLNLPPYTTYLITSNHLASFRPVRTSWTGKANQDRLAYQNALEMVAEKSHSYRRFIEQLNPGVDWNNLQPNTRVKVPLVRYPEPRRKASFLRISLTNRVLQAFDANTNLIAHFPCSIARNVQSRPVGELKITSLVDGPNYTFDPARFPNSPESKTLDHKLIIQPGPNNPVGTAWIGLSKPSYGIHGTPLPEKIGRTESLGCFRLANWDASYLLLLVS
ncbi:MAG: L,D-transpeptidase family protein, partial [Limisphaerales bacterium]